MRVQSDLRNESIILHPDFNLPAPWPTWYPGAGWESRMDVQWWAEFFINHWTIGIYASIVYVIGIIVGQRWMAGREAFKLKWPLVVWNAAMSLFSAIAVYQFLPYCLYTIATKGYTSFVCDLPTIRRREFGAWIAVIGLSRFSEFGDTAFLVLRKRPVIHLHWIHHSLVVIIGLWCGQFLPAVAVQGITINLMIHSYMYGYYAIRAAGVRVPEEYARWITRTQIIQMVLILLSCSWVYYIMEQTPRPCHNHPAPIYAGAACAALFMVLFINYFVQTYVLRSGKGKGLKTAVPNGNGKLDAKMG